MSSVQTARGGLRGATFASWNDRFRSEAISPVQNKLGHFLANPQIRRIVDQPKNRLDLRSIMDQGQILIIAKKT